MKKGVKFSKYPPLPGNSNDLFGREFLSDLSEWADLNDVDQLDLKNCLDSIVCQLALARNPLPKGAEVREHLASVRGHVETVSASIMDWRFEEDLSYDFIRLVEEQGIVLERYCLDTGMQIDEPLNVTFTRLLNSLRDVLISWEQQGLPRDSLGDIFPSKNKIRHVIAQRVCALLSAHGLKISATASETDPAGWSDAAYLLDQIFKQVALECEPKTIRSLIVSAREKIYSRKNQEFSSGDF